MFSSSCLITAHLVNSSKQMFTKSSKYTVLFSGDPAYDLYVKEHGSDPQQSKELAELMIRLADGTDETSINHL